MKKSKKWYSLLGIYCAIRFQVLNELQFWQNCWISMRMYWSHKCPGITFIFAHIHVSVLSCLDFSFVIICKMLRPSFSLCCTSGWSPFAFWPNWNYPLSCSICAVYESVKLIAAKFVFSFFIVDAKAYLYRADSQCCWCECVWRVGGWFQCCCGGVWQCVTPLVTSLSPTSQHHNDPFGDCSLWNH